jgi:ABC-2 type transport system permease protein
MREAMALIRARWLVVLSYRLQLMFSTLGVIVSIVPIYFISRALQPTMAGKISGEGQEYFAFLVIGLITLGFVTTATSALHASFSTDIGNGSLEAVLATPISLPALLTGMLGQAFTWTLIRTAMLLMGAWLLGAQIVWSKALLTGLVLALTVLAYVPFGIIAAALVLAFRSTGPVPAAIVAGSMLLGGVYYPTSVIPSWLAATSALVPLTYGLRSIRRLFIDGVPLAAVAGDVLILAGFTVVLFAVSLAFFAWAFRHARFAGTLSQY